MVEQTLDLEALDNHMYILKPEYDERLQELAKYVGSLVPVDIP